MRYRKSYLFEMLEQDERTPAWLARKVGCSEALLSRFRRGERTISGDLAERISLVMHRPVDAIFFEPLLSEESETAPAEVAA